MMLSEKLKELDRQFQTISQEIRFEISGRLVKYRNSQDELFEVKEYSANKAEVVLKRVFDNYQIILVADRLLSGNIRNLEPTDFNDNYRLLDKTEEIYWRKQMLSENYIFTIHYQIDSFGGVKECLF